MFVSGKEKFKNFYCILDGRPILGNPQGSSGNKNWTEVARMSRGVGWKIIS